MPQCHSIIYFLFFFKKNNCIFGAKFCHPFKMENFLFEDATFIINLFIQFDIKIIMKIDRQRAMKREKERKKKVNRLKIIILVADATVRSFFFLDKKNKFIVCNFYYEPMCTLIFLQNEKKKYQNTCAF